MKAVLIKENRRLSWEDVPTPVPREDEVLIEIHYAGLNRADLMQRAGDYPPPPGAPEWMGLEVSGVIAGLGAKVTKWKIGDPVCALLGGGGYAEYVTVPADMVMPVPEGITLAEAAVMPEAFATSYLNLKIEGQLQEGETFLMQAGASGLASVAIPMAKAFGARVFTTVLTDEAAAQIAPLGADRIIVTANEKPEDVLKAEMEAGTPVNVILDCLGGKNMGACLPYLSYRARWIMIAALAGQFTEIDLKNIYVKNIRIIGSTLRSRTPAMKGEILQSLVRDVFPKIAEGKLRPAVYKTFPITEAEAAHALMQSGKHHGKIALQVR